MDSLKEMVDEPKDEFNNFDSLFPSPDSEVVEEDKVVEKPKRGRPKKKVAEETEEKPKTRGRKKVKEETDSEKESKVAKKKSVDVSNLPMEIIDEIFKRYSKEPTAKIAKEFNLTPDQIVETIKILDEMFQLSVSCGDLTMEQFEEKIAPKLIPFSDGMQNFQTYVRCEVNHINDDEEESEED